MKTFEKIVLAVGLATLALLLWKMDAAAVFALVTQVGWGLAFIIVQEVVAHVFNAVGWRLAFPPREAGSFPLGELIRLRVAGDAVNYLTPSATIAGEVARTAMLNDSHGAQARAGSVLVSKVTQALAQLVFSLGGLALFAAQLPWLRGREATVYAAVASVFAALAAAAVYEARWGPAPVRAPAPTRLSLAGLTAMFSWLRFHFRLHPARFAGSMFFFFLGYAWGAFEAYWICRFLSVPVPVVTAILIEILSLTVDAAFFMVPAKVGTQEGGKTAIFAALGLPPQAGLAFGVVRHIRELSWAGLGLALCSAHRRRPSAPPSPLPAGAAR
ncbi:MAG: flippase-like domain-containing protein [Elusimicrobia bacterium]|nr:flippase-like domain-containing protein [Elusimicrobiota bacterium]